MCVLRLACLLRSCAVSVLTSPNLHFKNSWWQSIIIRKSHEWNKTQCCGLVLVFPTAALRVWGDWKEPESASGWRAWTGEGSSGQGRVLFSGKPSSASEMRQAGGIRWPAQPSLQPRPWWRCWNHHLPLDSQRNWKQMVTQRSMADSHNRRTDCVTHVPFPSKNRW